jgi:hypothetical protein
MLGAT